jgi:hypothetical protein
MASGQTLLLKGPRSRPLTGDENQPLKPKSRRSGAQVALTVSSVEATASAREASPMATTTLAPTTAATCPPTPHRRTAAAPKRNSRGALSHGVKTMHSCSVPRTARARATDAPRIAHPVALTPWQGKRHLWQEKRALFHLRHDDRVKKGVPSYLNSCPFSFPLSLLPQGPGKGVFRKRILPSEGNGPRALLLIRGSKVAPSGVWQPPRALELRALY